MKQYIKVEEHTAKGSSDAIVELPNSIYILEFKLDDRATPEEALEQIEAKGYARKYEQDPDEIRTIYKVGITFDNEMRTIGEWSSR
jgi:uncharacterized membrane-anchored protein YhcB (DUF1043 family)